MNFLLQHFFFFAIVQSVLSVEVTAPEQAAENVTVTKVLEEQNVTKTIVEEDFTINQLVPDIIPVAPKELIDIRFPSGVNASLGNKLTPTQVKDVPTLSWTTGIDQFYTLIAIDPDLPSRKKPLFRSTLQWCVMNIPGTNISSGDSIADYISAGPPEKSGLHRFTFLVYKQHGVIEVNETRLTETSSYGRHGFSVTDFAEKYNLGNPVAGNFFQTSYDSYVSILYRRLGVSKSNAVAPENAVIAILFLILATEIYIY